MRTLRAITLFAALLPLSAAITEPVHVADGLVSGIAGRDSEVRVFKGIPFAAPPVGDLRWRGPKAPQHWEGIRAADKFSDGCMQRRPPNAVAERAMSEDCLYLNVYTAAKSA